MIKNFSEFNQDQEAEKFLIEINKTASTLIFENNDKFSESIAEQLLKEGKTYNINKRYSIRYDLAHVAGQKDHLHFMVKGHEIGAMNIDKTPSHGTNLSKIPNKFMKFAKEKGFTEQTLINQDATTLVENRLYYPEENLYELIENFIAKEIENQSGI